MPAVSGYNPDVSIDNDIISERTARLREIDRAWAYYYGDHDLPLKVTRHDDNIIHNLNGQALDDMVSMMGIPRVEVAGGTQREPDAAGNLVTTRTPSQEFLDRWWAMHDMAEFMTDMALAGFVAGHVFVRLYWQASQNVEMPAMPRAALLDARSVVACWDEADVREVLWYRISWKQAGRDRRQDIVRGDLLEDGPAQGWVILEYVYRTNPTGWELVARDDWEFPFAPIVEWKNAKRPHQYYGRSDVRTRMNDGLNRVSSNTSKIIRHHAGPQTVVTGATLPDSIEAGPGNILELPNAEAKMYNLEMASDLGSSLEYMKMLRQAFFGEARVVDLATIGDKLGQITNFGVRMIFSRMVDLLTERRRLYGRGIEEISRRVLLMMGMAADDVTILWEKMLPQNVLEQLQALSIEAQIGTLSKQTIATELGRDFEQELERVQEEQVRGGEAVANTLVALGQRGLLGG